MGRSGRGGAGRFLCVGFIFNPPTAGVWGTELATAGGVLAFAANPAPSTCVCDFTSVNNALGAAGRGGGGGAALRLLLVSGVDVFMSGESEGDEIVLRLGVEAEVIPFFLIGLRFCSRNPPFVMLPGWFCFADFLA